MPPEPLAFASQDTNASLNCYKLEKITEGKIEIGKYKDIRMYIIILF